MSDWIRVSKEYPCATNRLSVGLIHCLIHAGLDRLFGMALVANRLKNRRASSKSESLRKDGFFVVKNLMGQRFGRLVVIRRSVEKHKSRAAYWECGCDCGGSTIARGGSLVYGEVKSCGCSHLVHGHCVNDRLTPTYRSWVAMLERCTQKNHRYFWRYGGRGIIVCERWHRFENFLSDMGERPVGMTLDRFPNGDGNYEPHNCRWATLKEQGRNRSTNNLLTLDGRTATIAEWVEITGILRHVICGRLQRGWSVERTLRP